MTAKPRILLCWGYSRANWTEYFEALNDQFEFVYLFHLRASEEKQVFTRNRRIFYMDYASARAILDDVRPSKVVFMGLDGLQTIAMNVECKKLHIPTYLMAHGGGTFTVEDARTFKWKERSLLQEARSEKLEAWLFTAKFLLRALGLRYLHALPALARYQVQKLRAHPLFAMADNKTTARLPSRYIVYSEEAIQTYQRYDDVARDKFIVLGDLEVGRAIRLAPELESTRDRYLLYIESPLAEITENEFDGGILDNAGSSALVQAMNRYALADGLRLVVKLHPYSYGNTYYPQHENIEYVRDTDKERLVLRATNVIFHNSSLAIMALLFKPCCMFTIGPLDLFQRTIASLAVCTVIDHEQLIAEPEKIVFRAPSSRAKREFVEKFVGIGIDGRGLERLADVLRS